MTPDVWVSVVSGGGPWVYVVMVDGKPYDEMTSTRALTWSEQADIASGYREALST